MKKSAVFLVCAACMLSGCIMNVQAEDEQSAERGPLFNFGVKGGVSLPSFYWLEDMSWNNVTVTGIMPAAWAFAAVAVTDTLAIQIEAGYDGKGCLVDAEDGRLLWKFNYVEIPVMAVTSIVLSSDFTVLFSGGGYFAKFLGGRYNFDVPESEWMGHGELSTGNVEKITEIRPYEYGLLIGVGIRNRHFLYEFRFPFGVTPSLAFTPADSIYGGYRRALNTGFVLAVG